MKDKTSHLFWATRDNGSERSEGVKELKGLSHALTWGNVHFYPAGILKLVFAVMVLWAMPTWDKAEEWDQWLNEWLLLILPKK